jgi:exopolysaccharide production protein ExoZ
VKANEGAMEKIPVLQAMRAFAAIAVLFYHAAGAAHKHGGPMPFFDLARLGEAGVDMFFVLSGFIILHATIGRGRSFRDYALARFRRIFLPYWPVGLMMAFFILGAMPHLGGVSSWIASVLLLPVAQPALNVAWTLQHELVFYAFVAIGYYRGWWRIGLAIWVAAILYFQFSGHFAPVGLQVIDSEFLMGIAAWAAWKDGQRSIMAVTSVLLSLLVLALLIIGQSIGIERAVPMAIAAGFAALLPWLVINEQKGRIRTPRVSNFLGDASYSIYLVHALPLLMLVQILAGSSWYILFLAIGFAGLMAGIAYHLLVERPLLAWREKS